MATDKSLGIRFEPPCPKCKSTKADFVYTRAVGFHFRCSNCRAQLPTGTFGVKPIKKRKPK